MGRILLLLFLIFPMTFTKASQCQSNGFTCIDTQHFQPCTDNNNQTVLSGKPVSCPGNYTCDIYNSSVTCKPTSSHLDKERLVPESGEIQCTGPGKFEAPMRYQYYECEPQLFFRWKVTLKTCPEGELFDPLLSNCTSTDVTKPECKGPSKHSAAQCFQYYECVQKFWWWQSKLRTCPKGQAFDPLIKSCVCAARLRCVGPDSGTSCGGPGTYPALTSCREYYQCTQVWWWWTPVLSVCPEGKNYDVKTCECVPEETADCLLRDTSTL